MIYDFCYRQSLGGTKEMLTTDVMSMRGTLRPPVLVMEKVTPQSPNDCYGIYYTKTFRYGILKVRGQVGNLDTGQRK